MGHDLETNPGDTKIGVVGAGSWGTALAHLLCTKGYAVDLWVYEPEVVEQILTHRENRRFLPGAHLPDNLTPSGDLAAVVQEKPLVLVVVPSHVMRRPPIGWPTASQPTPSWCPPPRGSKTRPI